MAVLLVASGPARAELQAPTDAPVSEAPERGPRGVWMGDQYRFPRFALLPGIVVRIGMDVISIPSSVGGWDGYDWALFGGVVGSTVLLSIPFKGRSLDVRLQDSLTNVSGGGIPRIWTPYGSFLIYTGVAAAAAGMMFVGATTPHHEVEEAGALAVEGMIVAEIYHIALKLLIGREGPLNAGRLGAYHGPTEIWFPNGWPSGHASALGGFVGAVATYFDDLPLLGVLLDTAIILLSVALITDNLHWTSDAIAGLVGGYAVGRWVVHHRSSRFRNADGNGWKRVVNTVQLGPAFMPGGGSGIAASWRF